MNIYILTIGYLEKRTPCFSEVTKDDKKMIQDDKEAETVFNSEKKTKKKGFT